MPLSDDSLDDYFAELRKAGIDAKLFAAFARNFVRHFAGSDDVGGGDDNVPGFEYVQRVSTAAFRALTAHGEELNGAWSEIRRGRYGFGMATKTWAKLTENYFAVFTEALRGPSQLPQPAWLVIPYSKASPPTPFYSVRIDGTIETGTELDYTSFEGMGVAKSTQDIYDKPPVGVGSRVEIRLNDAAIQALKVNTDHVGFIFRKGMGSATPFVIVVLAVTK